MARRATKARMAKRAKRRFDAAGVRRDAPQPDKPNAYDPPSLALSAM